MNWNRLGKALLFPHVALLLLLLPVAVVLLCYALAFAESDSVIAIVAYVLSAYTLTIWCLRMPEIVRFIRRFRAENKYARRFSQDVRFRVNVLLYAALFSNLAYAALQLGLGVVHASFWFYSLALYYLCLSLMRFFVVRYTTKHRPGENMRAELLHTRACGLVFLLMNLALSLMIFFMVYWNRTFRHHEITTIALAAYTFTALTLAIVGMVKYRRYRSPAYFAPKAISLAAGCVSMLTLESTMLTTFGGDGITALGRKLMLGLSGGAISAIIVAMAIYMIVQSTKKLKLLDTEVKLHAK